MHNIPCNFGRIHEICKKIFLNETDDYGNFSHYPRKPKLSDLEIIALASCSEVMSIDSENLLYGKLKFNEPEFFKKLPHRCNFNRRKRKLSDKINMLSARLSAKICVNNFQAIIDSMPLPICRMARSGRLKILRDDKEMLPTKAFSAIDKVYYHGYKLHMITSEDGVVINFAITQANVHDVKLIKDLADGFINNCTLIGDKGYISQTAQLDLFRNHQIKVVTPYRKNQKQPSGWNWKLSKTRKRIETAFSQFCDQFMFKRNYAKSFSGFYARITSKICAFTLSQYINFINQKPLNHIKYAFAF